MMAQHLSLFAFYSARMILGVLIILSVLSIAFFIERMLFFKRNLLENTHFLSDLEKADSWNDIVLTLKRNGSSETGVILKSLEEPDLSANRFSHRVEAYFLPERQEWERYSNFLGSVGSNAPFIGLLGTVLGIFKSFADISVSTFQGSQAVIAGISEALLATAVGLAVAIPAVVFFNICRTQIKAGTVRLESMTELIRSKPLFTERQD